MLTAIIIGTVSLVGCNSQPEADNTEIVLIDEQGSIDEMPIESMPSIVKRGMFRCQDDSVVYIDFFSDETRAQLRTAKDSKPIILASPAPGLPFVEGGYSVSGNGQTIQLRRPGKAEVTCKVGADA